MKTKTFADRLPQTGVAAQTTDNTAASTGNSGTVKIGKGSDESCAIKLHLSDSPVTIITGSGEVRANVGNPRARKDKTASLSVKDTKIVMQTILKAAGVILAVIGSMTLLANLTNAIVTKTKRKVIN